MRNHFAALIVALCIAIMASSTWNLFHAIGVFSHVMDILSLVTWTVIAVMVIRKEL